MRDYPHNHAKPIGELVAAVVAQALDMGRRQSIIDCIDDPVTKKILIVRWGLRGELDSEQVELLIIENELVAV